MSWPELPHAEITGAIIGAFYKVHNTLGYGFIEGVYVNALERELRRRGRATAREYAVRVYYLGDEVGFHRLDLLVDDVVVVEVKSTLRLPPVWRRQVFNYLRATKLEVALMLHFGVEAKYHRVSCLNRIETLGP